MPFPRGSRFSSFPTTPSPGGTKAPPVLGVGWRVIVKSSSAGARVTLTDDSGVSAVATVPDGAEVEILAWRPHRGSDTRYRVVATGGGVEGWVGGTSLRRRVISPAPRTTAAATPPVKKSKPAPKSTRKR